MNRIERIKHKLDVLKPQYLEIIDDSVSHAGHANHDDLDPPTHLIIKIYAKHLENYSNLEQHKIVNELLKEEFAQGLHAASIKILKHMV